ncbi:GNAT family N-acetyltransferase [Tsuneonella sp. YG55]|uniref:GNAT family N-acetyltransferase n=1 Tax=Tsuneonella litorea TaxID=2976475 RepID=A0A9X2W0N7_9SPHN|nr:GNAT family N-acetyltransferase [Tsuneonella litorea]MCT2558562.1 GNAT family N-acetyltransferase [Tsuneonella litorea]
MPTIVPLSAVDPQLVEDLLDRAFEPERRRRTSYRIREGTDWLPPLSFAALDDADWLIGTIQVWPVALSDPAGRAHPLLMVGPVAVLPGHQGEGYGKAMMAAALGAIDPAAPLPQVLIGDAAYYGPFGFVEAPQGWRCPGQWDPARLLVRCEHPSILPPEGMLGPWKD